MKSIIVILALCLGTAYAESNERHPRPHRELQELTREQFMQKAEERFAHVDTDGNGVLSVEEREAARRTFGEKVRARMHERNERRQERRENRE